jgi:hypothetical protein
MLLAVASQLPPQKMRLSRLRIHHRYQGRQPQLDLRGPTRRGSYVHRL